MKNRSVFFGRDENDQQILVAMELKAEEKNVQIHTFPKDKIDDAFIEKLNKDWVEGKEVDFPEGFNSITRSAEEEHLLPKDIKTDIPEKLRSIQNEWTLKLLSVRLYESINDEIAKLEGNLMEAGGYSRELWESAKKTWSNIGEHSKEFNLSREHTSKLRDRLNGFFDELKEKRGAHQEELASASKEIKDSFVGKLEDIKNKVSENVKLNDLFDNLKSLQKEIKDAQLTHKDRNKLWKSLDEAFAKVKDQRQSLRNNHLGKRVQGLERAIAKMEESIKRDRDSVAFQKKKLDSPASNQLEHQLRSTKIKVIEDRIRSKESKLADMYQTLEQLKTKLSKIMEKEAAAKAAAEKAAAEKTAAESATADKAAASKTADDMLAEAATPLNAETPPVAEAVAQAETPEAKAPEADTATQPTEEEESTQAEASEETTAEATPVEQAEEEPKATSEDETKA